MLKNFNLSNENHNNFVDLYRNPINEHKIFELAIPKDIERYIFIYDSLSNLIPKLDTDLYVYHPFRNYYIFPQNEKEKSFRDLWKGNLSENILDYSFLLEKAASIHMTYSDFYYLCQYLNLNSVTSLFIYTSDGKINMTSGFKWNFKEMNIKTQNYISGGRLGDVIYELHVILFNYLRFGVKGNLYISEDPKLGCVPFSRSLINTYNDVKNIISQQFYINTFEILQGNLDDYINLNDWRNQKLRIKTNWVKLLSQVYHLEELYLPTLIFNNEPQMNNLNNIILIHRSMDKNRHLKKFPWQKIIQRNSCMFVTCDISEYNDFFYKDLVKVQIYSNLEQITEAIRNCKIFVGNLSSPLAFAYSMNIPCLAELGYEKNFKSGLELFNDKFFWICKRSRHLNGIDKYINL